MSGGKQKKRLGKEQLLRIIDLCRSIEEKGIDPFLIDADSLLKIINEYFPEWKNPTELCLDAETLHKIASAIKLQSDWIKHHSTSLYTDPFLIEEKLRKLPKEEIVEIFLKSWHPVVELEKISPQGLTEALKYWHHLTPLDERWQKVNELQKDTEVITQEELMKRQIMTQREFSEELETFWQELKQKIEGKETIEYWSFVGAETYEETVERAYMTSFLVTYGYATLEVDRLEEVIYIKVFKTPVPRVGKEQAVSLPIPISVEDWKSWREGVKS
ncbi:MAG: hypothetical protein JSV51_02790 [Candidatus Bathyarchaeota archaeon]|nr:MAG: hypothetical protein JSV51_02790 [Candidatus Bathyarchaeota archaeon]